MGNEKKEWPLTLRLTDQDRKRLYEKAGEGGMTPGELLENFVRDLVRSDQSNGSDERDCAAAWYDRCGFEMLAKRGFLSYMLRYESVEDAVSMWNALQESEERLAMGPGEFCDQEDYESTEEDVQYWRGELEGYYEAYQKCCGIKGQGLEAEMQDLVEWYEGFQKLERGDRP